MCDPNRALYTQIVRDSLVIYDEARVI